MVIAGAALVMLLAGAALSFGMLFGPARLADHARSSLAVGACAATVTLSSIAVMVAAPTLHGVPLDGSIVDGYFLGMGHRLYGGPYPFFWTPAWIYEVSALAIVIGPCAGLTIATAASAWRANRTLATILVALGSLAALAFAATAVYVAVHTGGGTPV